jgi:beta-glucanase (GH16 family)
MRRCSWLLLIPLLCSVLLVPASAKAATLSGTAMPVGDLPGWHQTFSADFNTTHPLGSVTEAGLDGFTYAYNNPDTAGREEGTGSYWTPSVISTQNGTLDYYLHADSAGHNMSGAIGRPAMGQTYGRYAVRMRADAVVGYKTAFLLWPDSEVWPRDGEIDYPEGDLTGQIGGATHYQGGTSGGDQDVFENLGYSYPQWHTYTIEWTPSSLKYYVDTTLVHTTTQRIPNTPMHWVLQSETCLGGCQTSATASGHVQIDWATEYTYAPGTVPAQTPSTAPTATPSSVASPTTPTPTATPQPSTTPPTTPTATPKPSSTATPTSGTTSSASTSATAIRINAGGPAYTDSAGNVWQADRYATGGTADTTNVANAPDIFKTERWGANFRYDIPVPNGTYAVTLRFIECCNGAVGKRVFNVAINGTKVLDHFDVYAEKSWGTPDDRTFSATATDGALHIAFSALSGYPDVPEIAGIAVVGGPATTTSAAPLTTAPTATPQPTRRR